jgi:hypothetical protein
VRYQSRCRSSRGRGRSPSNVVGRYKPTRRLSLGRSRQFVWAPRIPIFAVVRLFRNRYRWFEFTSHRKRVLIFGDTPRLRLHLRDARHRRKPLSVGSCARRGQSLGWQVMRFHRCSMTRRDRFDGLGRNCEELIERKPTRRSRRFLLARCQSSEG